MQKRRYSAREQKEVEVKGRSGGAGEREKPNLPPGIVYVVPVRVFFVVESVVVIAVVIPGGHWWITLLPVVIVVIVVVVVVVVVVAGGLFPFGDSNKGSRRRLLTRRRLCWTR